MRKGNWRKEKDRKGRSLPYQQKIVPAPLLNRNYAILPGVVKIENTAKYLRWGWVVQATGMRLLMSHASTWWGRCAAEKVRRGTPRDTESERHSVPRFQAPPRSPILSTPARRRVTRDTLTNGAINQEVFIWRNQWHFSFKRQFSFTNRFMCYRFFQVSIAFLTPARRRVTADT